MKDDLAEVVAGNVALDCPKVEPELGETGECWIHRVGGLTVLISTTLAGKARFIFKYCKIVVDERLDLWKLRRMEQIYPNNQGVPHRG